MESSYLIDLIEDANGNSVLKIGFNPNLPTTNDRIVQDATAQLEELAEGGLLAGSIIRVNGPASVPVAFAIAHKINHLFGAVAVWDGKLGEKGKYVVAITHNPAYKLGDLID